MIEYFCSGPLNTSYQIDFTTGYYVYLHERDQFWPGLEMEQIGQTKLYIRTNTELKGHFTVIHKKSLDKTSAPCVSDDSYRYTNCIKDYVAITAGCHLDLVDNTAYNSKDHDKCITKEQVR